MTTPRAARGSDLWSNLFSSSDKTPIVGIVKQAVCETFGTLIITYFTLASIAVVGATTGGHAFSQAAAYAVAVFVFQYATHGHFNWIVTFGALVHDLFMFWGTKKGSWRIQTFIRVVVYWAAQYIGALLGVLLVWATTASRSAGGLGLPLVLPGSDANGFLNELIAGGFYVGVWLYTREMWREGTSDGHGRSLAIFLVTLGLVFIISPTTFALFNPAVYLAGFTVSSASIPAGNWWVWIFGAFTGAVGGAIIVIIIGWFRAWSTTSMMDTMTKAAAANKKKDLPIGGNPGSKLFN